MTSPRRRRDRPIESVELTVTLDAETETTAKVMRAFPSAIPKGDTILLRLRGSAEEVEEKTKTLLELVRTPASRAPNRRSDKRL